MEANGFLCSQQKVLLSVGYLVLSDNMLAMAPRGMHRLGGRIVMEAFQQQTLP